MITEKLMVVDAYVRSVLPTGRLKIEGKIIYQEVEVISHHQTKTQTIGITKEWIAVPKEFMDEVYL
jgi:hypothetical protein